MNEEYIVSKKYPATFKNVRYNIVYIIQVDLPLSRSTLFFPSIINLFWLLVFLVYLLNHRFTKYINLYDIFGVS